MIRTSTPSILVLLVLELLPTPTRAQSPSDELFRTGAPLVFSDADIDRRFAQSRFAKALNEPAENAACAALAGGLLTVLAEVGPTLHNRDDTFMVPPVLLNAVDRQLTLPRFPARAYLAAMVRRVRIDGKIPRAWLEQARALRSPLIDMDKLQFLTDGPKWIDSYLLTLAVLQDRYASEVSLATSSVSESAEAEFAERYLDRTVAWGGLALVDVGAGAGEAGAADKIFATVEFRPPKPQIRDYQDLLNPKKPVPATRIKLELAPTQYVKVHRLRKGTRVIARGRIYAIGSAMKEITLRDALLFEDREWPPSVALAPPGSVAQCPWAVNDLGGMAPRQPGGFGKR